MCIIRTTKLGVKCLKNLCVYVKYAPKKLNFQLRFLLKNHQRVCVDNVFKALNSNYVVSNPK